MKMFLFNLIWPLIFFWIVGNLVGSAIGCPGLGSAIDMVILFIFFTIIIGGIIQIVITGKFGD